MFLLLIAIVYADELLSVHIMWRHGARKPYFCNWGCDAESKKHFSQLTPAGMREHYVLGQWLRKRYIDTGFLSETFNENEIYIESSDTNRYSISISRTLMSAYSNLIGMYPEGPLVPDVDANLLLPPINGVETPTDIQNFALPNRIQLIPIHTREQLIDYTIYMYCPILWDDGKHNENTEVFKDINGRVQPLIKQFNEELNQNISTIFHLYQWRDTFISYQYQDLELPAGLTAEMMDKLNKVAGLGFLLEYNQDYYQGSLLTSPFYSGLLDSFDAILNKTSKIKYHAYSAHDSNIYASLYTLNLTSVECYNQTYFEGKSDNPNCITTYPDYASNIIYELYNSSILGPYVKVLYNGTYMNICNPAAQTCSYQHFKTLLKSVSKDYVKECNITQPIQQIEEKTPWWAVTFFVLVLALCVCSFSMVIVIFQKKQKLSQDFEKV